MLKNMQSWLKILALGLAVILLCSGCATGNAAAPVSGQAQQATAVGVEQLKKTTIQNELTYIGQVEPQRTIHVISKLAAEVLEVHFDIGDTVQEGDVLFTVNAKDIEDQIKVLQATMAAQEIGVESAIYGYETATGESAQTKLSELQTEMSVSNARYGALSAGEGYDLAKDMVEMLEDNLDAAEQRAQQVRALLATTPEPVPPAKPSKPLGFSVGYELEYLRYQQEYAEYQQAKAEYNALLSALAAPAALSAELEQAKLQRAISRNTYNQTDNAWDLAGEIYSTSQDATVEGKERAARQAEFGVRVAAAQLNATNVQLAIAQAGTGNAIVTSPLSGVISSRNIEVGQMISPQTVPFTVIDMDTVNVSVSVSETLINYIRPGDKVEVVVQALGDTSVTGTVEAVSPAAGATGTYPIRVRLDNAGGLIKPGMFAQVTFVKERAENTIVVPKYVVQSDESSQFVYVVRDGVAVRVNVVTGLSGAQDLEILSGVTEQDMVVVLGQEYLSDGTPVRIVAIDGQRVTETPEETNR